MYRGFKVVKTNFVFDKKIKMSQSGTRANIVELVYLINLFVKKLGLLNEDKSFVQLAEF